MVKSKVNSLLKYQQIRYCLARYIWPAVSYLVHGPKFDTYPNSNVHDWQHFFLFVTDVLLSQLLPLVSDMQTHLMHLSTSGRHPGWHPQLFRDPFTESSRSVSVSFKPTSVCIITNTLFNHWIIEDTVCCFILCSWCFSPSPAFEQPLINLWRENFSILNKSAGRCSRWWRNLCDSCPCQNVFKARRQECEGLNSCHNSTPVLTGSTFLLGSTSTEFDTDFNGKRNDGGEMRSNRS